MSHVITLAPPEVTGGEVHFHWSVTPATLLYKQTSFSLRFPPSVALARVPESLWWRIGLMCLHAHWPLLRPCRVVLPVALPPEEVEFWLRLTDAAVNSLEGGVGSDDTQRRIELIGLGPPLPLARLRTASVPGGVVSLFSGGRDGMTQAAMLSELGETPTLVAVTSPRDGSVEHETPRRAEVLAEMTRRRGLEVVQVHSDFRGIVANDFATRWGVAVSEISDTLLFMAVAVAVAAARDASLITIASENEVQDSIREGGQIIQARHFMYAAPIIHALSTLLEPAGIAVTSLTYPLRQFQVQRLLSHRYADLRDMQYSCWSMSVEQAACSSCPECRGIALNLLASGVPPSVAGIDVVTLLDAFADWQPGDVHLSGAPPARRVTAAGRDLEIQAIRALQVTAPERVGELIDSGADPATRERTVAVFATLRERAQSFEIEPEPGYAAGYLDLIHPRVRARVQAILDEHFTAAAPDSYATRLDNARVLRRWLAAPLSRPRLHDGAEDDTSADCVRLGVSPPPPVRLSDRELAPIRELIPAPEPSLVAPPGGRALHVSETLLDGNELAYVTECVETNWISSAGAFVTRFEAAFADAIGCGHAVACSSGTAAVHLALAATGVAEGDEVIVPAFTMIGTANAARYLGATPVLVDADAATWNLDPDRVAEKLTPRTRAIVAVHIYGQPADMDALRDLADRHSLILVEDAAEAHGADLHGRQVGGLGDVGAFSLYGNKILTSGEGGVVTTDDERVAEVARAIRSHAFSQERHFWHARLGFNYRMTNLQAAVALAQTERMAELVERRRATARAYFAALEGIEGVGLPPQLPGGVTWMFGITISPEFGISRDDLRCRLAAQGVETRTFFVPIHLQPIYRRSHAGQRYPVSEQLGATGLYLPSGPSLSGDDIAYVADAVRSSRERAGATPSAA